MGKHHWPVDRTARVLGTLPALGLVGSVGTVSLALTSGTGVFDDGTTASGQAPSITSQMSSAYAPARPPAHHLRADDAVFSAGLAPPTGLGTSQTHATAGDETAPAAGDSGPSARRSATEPDIGPPASRDRTESSRPRSRPTVAGDAAPSVDRAVDGNDRRASRPSAGSGTDHLSQQESRSDVEDDAPTVRTPIEQEAPQRSVLPTGTMLSFGSNTVALLP